MAFLSFFIVEDTNFKHKDDKLTSQIKTEIIDLFKI